MAIGQTHTQEFRDGWDQALTWQLRNRATITPTAPHDRSQYQHGADRFGSRRWKQGLNPFDYPAGFERRERYGTPAKPCVLSARMVVFNRVALIHRVHSRWPQYEEIELTLPYFLDRFAGIEMAVKNYVLLVCFCPSFLSSPSRSRTPAVQLSPSRQEGRKQLSPLHSPLTPPGSGHCVEQVSQETAAPTRKGRLSCSKTPPFFRRTASSGTRTTTASGCATAGAMASPVIGSASSR